MTLPNLGVDVGKTMQIEVTRAGLENKVVTPTRSLGSKKQDLTWSDPSHPLPLGLAALEPGKCLEGLPWVNRTGVTPSQVRQGWIVWLAGRCQINKNAMLFVLRFFGATFIQILTWLCQCCRAA